MMCRACPSDCPFLNICHMQPAACRGHTGKSRGPLRRTRAAGPPSLPGEGWTILPSAAEAPWRVSKASWYTLPGLLQAELPASSRCQGPRCAQPSPRALARTSGSCCKPCRCMLAILRRIGKVFLNCADRTSGRCCRRCCVAHALPEVPKGCRCSSTQGSTG